MKNLIGTLLLLISFSCCKNKFVPEYPAIIKNNNLQDLYDKAKWEIYKLNTLVERDYETDYLVSLSDSLYDKFIDAQLEYGSKRERKYLTTDKDSVIKILGQENVKDFLEVALKFSELDSSIMFQNDEILLLDFGRKMKLKKMNNKVHINLFYTYFLLQYGLLLTPE